ncbi:porin [Bradyrhizobium sp. Tv2a-2]|uniref:porin n=1 Tax=Bradyrhizobium sp. Tv2a-2 TaxID=113395 RepID=UPI0004646193|nr:porin [Bradyrhizobium sp. Tv2a-2]
MSRHRQALLGLLATCLVAESAQAADLPLKAKAIEYVKVCSLYGAGFWYIPGTDTCIKIGGYLRVDTGINAGGPHGQPAWSGDSGQGNRFYDYFSSRSRLALTVDTRTSTEYGVVRTFGEGRFQFNNFGSSNPSTVGAAPTALGGISGTFLDGVGGGYVAVGYVFIQFAGFTFGKSASPFSSPWQGFLGNINSFFIGGETNDNAGVPNVQYTAEFGNGVSATIGAIDPTVFARTPVYNLGIPGAISSSGTGSNAYGGFATPDFAGNVRIDQAWGLLQFSGVAHAVSGSYNALGAGAIPISGATALTDSVLSGHPETKWGGAAMIALQIKNLPTGAGDDIKLDSTYSKGATKYVISTASTSPSFAMFGGSGFAYQSVGFGATSDGVYLPVANGGDGNIHLTTSWGVRGAFNHHWDPYWSTSLFAGYAALSYDGSANDNLGGAGLSTAKGAYCSAFAASHPGQARVASASGNYTCNPDYEVSQVGLLTQWTPVKNLTFSAEVDWFHLYQHMSGSSVFTPSAPQPTALYQFKDQNTVLGEVRVQRNF